LGGDAHAVVVVVDGGAFKGPKVSLVIRVARRPMAPETRKRDTAPTQPKAA
jgi:hypothetical protein